MTQRNIVHIEIPAKDAAGAGEFYREMFGWKITSIPEMNYTMWEPEQAPGGGFSPLGDGVEVGDVLVYISSDDIEADLRRVAELGGQVVRPKMEIPGTGWFGIFKDPTGNTLALYTSMDSNFNA
jgi:hypothetical protein